MDGPPVSAPPLRPLGVGEMLDRAVTLSVRNFPTFAAILAIFLIPLAVVQYFETAAQAKALAAMVDAIQAKPGTPSDPKIFTTVMRDLIFNPWLFAFGLAQLLVMPLPTGALIEAAREAYRGETPNLKRAYAAALPRWPALVALNLLYIGAAVVAYFALSLVVVAFVFAIAAAATVAHVLGVVFTVVGVVFGIAASLAVVAFIFVAALAYQVSFFTCVIERAKVGASFARGVRRVFGAGLKRSLLVSVAYAAIAVGVLLVSLAGQSVVVGLLHARALGTAFSAVLQLATASFFTVFIAIFYFDLRVRGEGFDLHLASEPLVPPAT